MQQCYILVFLGLEAAGAVDVAFFFGVFFLGFGSVAGAGAPLGSCNSPPSCATKVDKKINP